MWHFPNRDASLKTCVSFWKIPHGIINETRIWRRLADVYPSFFFRIGEHCQTVCYVQYHVARTEKAQFCFKISVVCSAKFVKIRLFFIDLHADRKLFPWESVLNHHPATLLWWFPFLPRLVLFQFWHPLVSIASVWPMVSCACLGDLYRQVTTSSRVQ